jgi:hypothetical protein
VGANILNPIYSWRVNINDGAQIELNQKGINIRDIDGVVPATTTTYATVTTMAPGAGVLKNQILTLENNATLSLGSGISLGLWLVGDTDASGGGAILRGSGKLVAGQTTIIGGELGWQAVGDTLAIRNNGTNTSALVATNNTTPAVTLKALGLGATITQAAAASASGLTIDENVTISLGGTNLKKGGEIVLIGDDTDPGMITFTDETSKITTANTIATPVTELLADDGDTAITGTTDVIGITDVLGDGSLATVTTTAVVNSTNSNLLSGGYLISLQGDDTTGGGTIQGGDDDEDGKISSQTTTVADITP